MGVNRFFLLLLHRFGFYVRTDNAYKYNKIKKIKHDTQSINR